MSPARPSVEITTRDGHTPRFLRKIIRDRVEKLCRYYPRIRRFRIAIAAAARPGGRRKRDDVSLDVRVPGKSLHVTRSSNDDIDPRMAVHQAFDAMRRQLEDDTQRSRRQVKRHSRVS